MNESLVEAWTCGACYEDLYFCNQTVIEDNSTDTFAFIGSTYVPLHSFPDHPVAFRTGTMPSWSPSEAPFPKT